MNKLWRRKQKARAAVRKHIRVVHDRILHLTRQGYQLIDERAVGDLWRAHATQRG